MRTRTHSSTRGLASSQNTARVFQYSIPAILGKARLCVLRNQRVLLRVMTAHYTRIYTQHSTYSSTATRCVRVYVLVVAAATILVLQRRYYTCSSATYSSVRVRYIHASARADMRV